MNLGSQYLSITLGNDSVSGTVQNRFVVLNSSGKGALAGTTASGRIIGVCVADCGSTGNARVATRGQVLLQFDGSTTAGNYVKVSTTTAGKAMDAGTSRPTSGQILGYVLSTNTSAGTYSVILEPDIFADYLPGLGDRVLVASSYGPDAQRQSSPFRSGDKVKPMGTIAVQKSKRYDLSQRFDKSVFLLPDLLAKTISQDDSTKHLSKGCNQNIPSEDSYALTSSVTISE